ncbi:MAG: TonB-dependent receptor [Alphaproteobacteria bacterium]|nr:MAG: TonB-dependent receptor [Alphaproteobacteria bacterium]
MCKKLLNQFMMSTATISLLIPLSLQANEADNNNAGVTMLEEITVTARKKEEGLQNAPISITAFTGRGLDYRGITNISSMADFTPNLTFQNNPGDGGSSASAAIYIRGVGQNDFVPTVEPGVGLYVDGVYIARSIGAILDIVDVERIEVLRGPQGTLFGRNTIGGAISIITKKPNDELGGRFEATTGSANRIDIRANVNIPLSETFFMKVSGATFNRDGYVTRPFDNKDLGNDNTLTGRVAFTWLPTENLSINLSIDGTRDRENGSPMVTTALIPTDSPAYLNTFMALNNILALGDPFSCFSPANLNNPQCYNTSVIQGDQNINGGTAEHFSDLNLWGTSLEIKLDLDNISFKSVTAYRNLDSQFARDIDESAIQIGHVWDDLQQDQFTQEFQINGTSLSDKMDWLFGLYYFKENSTNLNILSFLPATFQSGGHVESKSWAIFGQSTYSVTDELQLTLGLRYTEDDKSFLPDQFISAVHVPAFIFPFPVGTALLPNEEAINKIGAWTPMANLSYQWNEDFMTYASYSEGFKSGGYTQRIFPPETTIPQFAPEFVKVYEIGFKFSGLDNRLRINGAAFHTDYDDLQVLITNQSQIGPFTSNAGKATIKGAELEVSAIPAEGWFFEAGLGYLDPEYTALDAGVSEITLDSKFSRISEWTLSAALSKEIMLGNAGTIRPRLDWSFRSGFYNDVSNSEEIYQQGYHLLNANVTWLSSDEKYEAVFGVTNLTDERYLETGYIQPNFGNFESLFARERQWYLTVRYNF